jgi:serine/threonine-protein kinase
MPTMALFEQLQRDLGTAYRLERELGGGGMSRVFEAEDASLKRRVVVKVLAPDLAAGLNQERFRREIQLAARLQHSCIVPVLSAGEAAGLPYYTMPFVDGESLRARLSRDGALPAGEVARIMRDVAEALSYAHEQSVIHRDIKPDNILLSRHHALVADFGVAKALSASSTAPPVSLTQLGTALGTPAYMAPEQAAADDTADHRVDLYALGVVAYEALTGKPLFGERTPQAMLVAHAVEQPKPLRDVRSDVPAGLASLVMRLLEKNPDARPQSADDVLRELDVVATPGATVVSSGVAYWNRSPATHRRRLAGIVVIVATAAAVAAAFVASRGRRVPSATAKDTVRSIAVLPFDAAGEGNDRYLSDGISEELIDALSKVRRLRVAGRSSSFAFRGKAGDTRTIGKQLGVSAILTGSVQRSANRIRVRAQLADTDSGFTMWSETYDRDMTDVFAVQDEISRAIVSALQVKLAGTEQAALASRQTNVKTYENYLQGLFYWNQRGEGILNAIPYFERAIAGDSTYAPAYAGLAESYLVAMDWNFVPILSTLPKAKALAKRGIELDSLSPEAHSALADILAHHEYAWDDAEREYKRAIELNPGYATAHYFYSWFLSCLGRYDDAIAEGQRAHELEPLSMQILSTLGRAYHLSRRPDEGLAMYHTYGDSIPVDAASHHAWLAIFYARKRDAARAVAEANEAYTMSAKSPLFGGLKATTFAFLGMRDSAMVTIRALERLPNHPSYHVSSAYASLNDDAKALDWLERAYDERNDWICQVTGEPGWDHLRTNPRFLAVMRKLKLPAGR